MFECLYVFFLILPRPPRSKRPDTLFPLPDALPISYDSSLTDKLSVFVDDMRRLNVRCLPPCVNRSGPDFTVEQDAEGLAVRYALGALKGVGEKATGDLVAARDRGGPFTSLHDFAGRIDPRQLNKRQIGRAHV